MDIGLPPASPSEKDIDLKVHYMYLYMDNNFIEVVTEKKGIL